MLCLWSNTEVLERSRAVFYAFSPSKTVKNDWNNFFSVYKCMKSSQKLFASRRNVWKIFFLMFFMFSASPRLFQGHARMQNIFIAQFHGRTRKQVLKPGNKLISTLRLSTHSTTHFYHIKIVVTYFYIYFLLFQSKNGRKRPCRTPVRTVLGFPASET